VKTTQSAASLGQLADLLPSWQRHLRATNKSPRTVQSYLEGAEQFMAFLTRTGMPTTVTGIAREHIEAFELSLLEKWKPATVANRHRSLQQLFRWLEDEGEIARSPMAKMSGPKVPVQPVPVLTLEQLNKLLGACEGPTFNDRRDMAIIRLMVDTGIRLGELANLTMIREPDHPHVDLDDGSALVLGKGGSFRVVYIEAETVRALDRYLRLRARHRWADHPAFWIGQKGKMHETGVAQMLRNRSERAGIGHVHAHMLRHYFAHRWKAQGLSEESLMRIAGWRSSEMVRRYAASAADERARDEHRRFQADGRI
jgi:site-specific recombinase XerD